MEIKARTASPGMACEDGRAFHLHMGVKIEPSTGENFFKDPLEGENGRAGIDSQTAILDKAHFAAGCGCALQKCHVEPTGSQQKGGRETAHARSDHDHPVFCHGAPVSGDLSG